MKPKHILIILALVCGLASCAIPPSPAVMAHAGGGAVGVAPNGQMMVSGSSGQSIVNMEAAKAQGFWK